MRRSIVFLLILGLAGCATAPDPAATAYTRGDQQFGVVKGTFRARWWNHYERGRSFLDGGFHAEAAADFQIALAQRAEDQRWARTYGLHFIPEYFPNRELGIARFQEGQLDEAQRLLERSLAQEHTALAAHYLDQVRAAQIQQRGGDAEAPRIEADTNVFAQAAGAGMQTLFRARITDNTYVAQVTINGAPHLLNASAPAVDISAPLQLAAGANEIKVIATDIAGNSVERIVQIARDFDGPAVSFEPATDEFLTGLVHDPAGVAAFTLGDKRAELQALSPADARFHVAAPGAASFTATDRLGNVTTGRLPGTAATASAARVRLAGNVGDTWAARALAGARIAAETGAQPSGIRLANLAEGQRYLMDEIVVSIEASGDAGITAIEIDGAPLTGIVPGAKAQYLSRRIRLDAMGQRTIHAKMTDTAGHVSETEVTIERAPTDIERPEERLRVALLGNLWEGAGPTLENEADFVAEELSSALFRRGRVDLVSRDALPRVLEEQELRTVLGSRDLAPGLRQIVPADLLAVGKVRRTGDTVEIVLQAVSSETSNILAYADVAGAVNSLDDLRALARDLALRFEQEFPQVTGTVVNVPAPDKCFSTLAAADRVRPELPCVIYRLGEPIVHPATGAVLGRPAQVIARGSLAEVQRQMSRIVLGPPGDGAGPVQVNDHVATR